MDFFDAVLGGFLAAETGGVVFWRLLAEEGCLAELLGVGFGDFAGGAAAGEDAGFVPSSFFGFLLGPAPSSVGGLDPIN